MALADGTRSSRSAAKDEAEEVIGKAKKKARGRKDNSGQEAIIDWTPLKEATPELLKLTGRIKKARDALNDKIKAVAVDCNANTKAVRSIVTAYGGNFEKQKRDAEQLAMAFENMPAPETVDETE